MTRSFSSRSRFYLTGFFIAALALSGCAVPHGVSLNAPNDIDEANEGYLIMPGDKLHVTVYGDETMSKDFTVNANGKVALPLLGQTAVKGLTPDEAEEQIIAALKKRGFMNGASVTVDSSNTRPIYVLGEVKLPGVYPYQPDVSGLQAVATAGGYTPRAAQDELLIDRKIHGRITRMNAGENTPILPGDTIIIRERVF